MEHGATIERGEIKTAVEDRYTVVSLDRRGIESPPILATDGSVYTVGDMVYFFLFADGTGRIICKV